MELKHIKSFLRVLDLGSFSRAAKSLHIAQPALSQHVRKLEEHLGVVLLERTSRGVAATRAGQAFSVRARTLVEMADQLRNAFRTGPGGLYGEVHLGLPGSICPVLAVPLILDAQEQFPNVRLIVSEFMSGDLAQMLREGRMDLAILFNVTETDDYSARPLVTERLHLVGRADEGSPAGETIAAQRLVGVPIASTRPPHGLRLLIDRWSSDSGIGLTIEHEIDAPSALIAMAESGVCRAILSHAAVRDKLAQGSLYGAEITGPAIERTACLCESKRRPSDPARAAIADLARRSALKLVAEGIWRAVPVLEDQPA